MKYVFIVACPRSGTSWLQLLLAQHPAVATTLETHLFNGYLAGLENSWQRYAHWSGLGMHSLAKWYLRRSVLMVQRRS